MEITESVDYIRKSLVHSFLNAVTGTKGEESLKKYRRGLEEAKKSNDKLIDGESSTEIFRSTEIKPDTTQFNNTKDDLANLPTDTGNEEYGNATTKTLQTSEISSIQNLNKNTVIINNNIDNYETNMLNLSKIDAKDDLSGVFKVNFSHVEQDESIDLSVTKFFDNANFNNSFLNSNNSKSVTVDKEKDESSKKTHYIDTTQKIKEKIDEVRCNSCMYKLFMNDPLLNPYQYYNTGYYYGKIANPVSQYILQKNWDDPEAIFNHTMNESNLKFNIYDLDRLVHHKLHKFEIYYYFEHRRTKHIYFCKWDHLYSNHLIDMTHQYYRLNDTFDRRYLAEATIIHELRNIYLRFKNMINPEITLEIFLNPRTTCSNKKINDLPLIEITEGMIDNITETVRTKDDILSVIVKDNSVERIVPVEDVNNLNDGYFKDQLSTKLNSNEVKEKNSQFSVDNLILKTNYRKKEKTYLKKWMRKNNHDKFINLNNCFYLGITSISTHFWDSSFRKMFKSLGYLQQIEKANNHLSRFGETLKNVYVGKSKLADYVKTVKGYSLIIFYENISKIHVEAAHNGNFCNELQSYTLNLLETLVNIKEYRLELISEKNDENLEKSN